MLGFNPVSSSPVSAQAAAITPVGIAGAEAFGVPAVGATIGPTALAGSEAFGTQAIVPSGAVFFFGIAGSEAFGVPSVGAAISPVAILGAESFGTSRIFVRLNDHMTTAGVASHVYSDSLSAHTGVAGLARHNE